MTTTIGTTDGVVFPEAEIVGLYVIEAIVTTPGATVVEFSVFGIPPLTTVVIFTTEGVAVPEAVIVGVYVVVTIATTDGVAEITNTGARTIAEIGTVVGITVPDAVIIEVLTIDRIVMTFAVTVAEAVSVGV